MLTVRIQGEDFVFEGINGELDGRGYTNATEFYNKQNAKIVKFIDLTSEPSDIYHSLFMNTLFTYIQEEVVNDVGEITIDLDTVISDIGGCGKVYSVEVEDCNSLYRQPNFVTYFKLFTIVDFLLIPIHNVEINGDHTEIKYGNKVMIKVAPSNRRFPPFVSERIVTGEIDKLSEKHILGYKYLNLDNVTKYGVSIDYVNYRG